MPESTALFGTTSRMNSWQCMSLGTLPRRPALTFMSWCNARGESIRDYYLRVCETFDKMCEAKPGNIGTLRTVPAAVAAAVPAIMAADLTAMKTEGIKDMEQFFRHQFFMAGLRDDL